MTTDDTFGQHLTAWLHEEAGHRVPDHLGEVLVQTAATRQRKWWTSPERWLPVDTATDMRGRIAAPRSLVWLALIALVILAILATAIATGALRAPGPIPGLATNGRILVADGPTLKSFAADGSDPRTVMALPARAEYLVLSHDGTRLGMAVSSDPNQYMAVVRLGDASSTALPTLAGAVGMGSGLTWSPDDQRVAYINYDGSRDHIIVGPSDGSTFTVMATDPIDPSFGLWSPVWSPDGRWLAFVAAGYRADNTTEPGIDLSRPPGRDGAARAVDGPGLRGGRPQLVARSGRPAPALHGRGHDADGTCGRRRNRHGPGAGGVVLADVVPGRHSLLLLGDRGPDDRRRAGRAGPGDHRHPRLDRREELRGAQRAQGPELLRSGRVLTRRHTPHRSGHHGLLDPVRDGRRNGPADRHPPRDQREGPGQPGGLAARPLTDTDHAARPAPALGAGRRRPRRVATIGPWPTESP